LAVTFFRIALMLSRAMILLPMAAWIATSNICRGISWRSFSATLRPYSYALSRWMITLKASTGSPLIIMSSFCSGFARYSANS
jgi:hypothetical protein